MAGDCGGKTDTTPENESDWETERKRRRIHEAQANRGLDPRNLPPARARGALGVSDPEGGGGASGAGFAAGVGRRRRAVVETGEMSGEAESG